jgi:hypothetical protein
MGVMGKPINPPAFRIRQITPDDLDQVLGFTASAKMSCIELMMIASLYRSSVLGSSVYKMQEFPFLRIS